MTQSDFPRSEPASGNAAKHLVVLCHGLGADGFDLIDIAAAWAQAVPDAAFIAPHAPFPCELAPHGRQWFSVADRTPAVIEPKVRVAQTYLDGFIDAELARLSLAPDAYALMGFSQGAMMVLYAGLRRPVPPRAILAYSGALMAPDRLAETVNRAPILLVHGEDDEVVSVLQSRDAEAALRAGGFSVESLYCPGLGHGIDEAGLSTGALFLQRYLGSSAMGA
jgi:phospholipase/carboxylesterase